MYKVEELGVFFSVLDRLLGKVRGSNYQLVRADRALKNYRWLNLR